LDVDRWLFSGKRKRPAAGQGVEAVLMGTGTLYVKQRKAENPCPAGPPAGFAQAGYKIAKSGP